MRFHMANSNYLEGLSGSSPVALPGLSFEIDTSQRDVTLVDQLVVNSPLTLDNVLVRGVTFARVHGFFTRATPRSRSFRMYCCRRRKTWRGFGYRFRLGVHTSLTPNLYYVAADTGLAATAHSGAIGSLVFRHEVTNRLKVLAETGYGRGMGVAGRLDFQRSAEERLSGDFRYEPASFSSVSVNNLHGVLSTFRWDRKFHKKLTSSANFSGNRYDLAQSTAQVNVTSDWNLDYRLSKHWSANSGLVYSRFSGGIGAPVICRTSRFPWE